ncbi:MAG: hypothetical protein LBR17_09610 [Bacteroidales bacterium]|jgi:lipopolysaccharide assembly outer membrane protein LptD (OstA)|nr:hypothetical protein [Bacteroidales bacterium]
MKFFCTFAALNTGFMVVKKRNYIIIAVFVFIVAWLCGNVATAQDTIASYPINDTLSSSNDTTMRKNDTSNHKKQKPLLDSRIDYKSKDSIVFDFQTNQVYLYNEGEVNFSGNALSSGFISINFDSNSLYATQIPDSSNQPTQYPIFKDNGKEYQSTELNYNFDSKKGVIRGVFTKEGEGFLHGEKVKKVDDNTMYISGGMFTTCDEPKHPHFAINFSKGKAVTGDKIVTGPAWFSIMEIPLPVGLPFGYFPFTDKQKSGLLIPTYGYAANRGYYFSNAGWYFYFNDYVDLALQGDIYTNLSYALNARSNYVKKYKYKGRVEFRFEDNHSGLRNTPNYGSQSNFKFTWSHTQDTKAHPFRSFSANVNLVSQSYSQNTMNVSDRFTNTTTSSIAFSTRFGSKVSFTANLGESYNVNTGAMALDLPSITLSTTQLYPFKNLWKQKEGKTRWYEEISISYRMNLANKVEGTDTILFSNNTINNPENFLAYMRNGIQHSIPVQSNIKFLKHFNWSNSINYTERWYSSSIARNYDAAADSLITDTSFGFVANRDVRFASSINTKIYGMFNFKGFITAIRHVIDPSVSFNLTPDFSSRSLGFYNSYIDRNGKEVRYSKTANGIFGSPPDRMSGVIQFALRNNLEMKVKSKSDTITGTKKYVLFENVSVSSGYDLAADSCNWQPLAFEARTTLFDKLRISFNASLTPYVMDSLGRLTNELLWDKEGVLFKETSSTWSFNLTWQLNGKKAEKEKTNPQTASTNEYLYSPFANPNLMFGQDVDFNIPWSLAVTAQVSRTSQFRASLLGYESTYEAVLNFRGDVNVTSKWKVGFSTGYDFKNKDFTNTSIDFYRDLHCWEMRMNWTPFGYYRGWNFTIAVKASMLQDLKYEKRDDFRNRLEY